MSRIQLALNVDDIDEAVEFYARLFATQPAKREPGYANFAIAEPPLKLVLIEREGVGGTINHLGVEVETQAEVAAATRRLAEEGLETLEQENVSCCYAAQDKVWVSDPSGARWEVYTVLADLPSFGSATDVSSADGCACAAPEAAAEQVPAGATCC
jgi:catechol 2,3-dioxygenase-like lactoylglutathione lyase family enzyme